MNFAGQNAGMRRSLLSVIAVAMVLALTVSTILAQHTKGKRQRWDSENEPKPSLALASLSGSATTLGTTTSVRYSGAGDFSATQNPNGVWSYGYISVLGGAFTRYTLSSDSGFIGWFGPVQGDAGGPPGFPLIIASTAANPSLLNIHPSPELYSVLRWTAPANGRWDVVGDFTGTGVTTTDVHVLKNGVSLLNSPVNNSDNVPFSLIVSVQAGDTIDLAVGPGPTADSSNDSTNTRVVIAPHLYDFTTIDYPGAISTQLNGTNEQGDVVGFYSDTTGGTHGFLYSQGKFSAIDFPGAVLTQASGINDAGEIVGLYDENSTQASGFEHGFVLRGGRYARLDFPGASDTDIFGVNEQGNLAGAFDLGDMTTSIGFLTNGSQFSSFEVPGSAPLSTIARGINGSGQVVGYSSDSANPDAFHGFLRQGNRFTAIDYPGAELTFSTGINGRGDIVGRCICIDSQSHGYLLRGGVFTVVDFPRAGRLTRVRGINDRGQIVGGLNPPGGAPAHGFIATPVSQ